MTNQKVADREYCTFKELAARWKVSEDQIEGDLLNSRIHIFQINWLNVQAPIEEVDRNYRLLAFLNNFAKQEIGKLLQSNRLKSRRQKQLWEEYANSDRAFEAWLSFYGSDINKVRVVIPYEEVIRRDKALNIKDTPVTKKNMLVEAIVQQVARELYEKTKKWPKYLEVLKAIKREAHKDGHAGIVVDTASKDGIVLSNGDKITVKTVQNWLTNFKKKVLERVVSPGI